MGEYWKPVNVTKREYIHPHDMNDGLKMPEWNYPESATSRLMADRWADDDVVVAVSDNDGYQVLRGVVRGKRPTYGDLDRDGYRRVNRASSPPVEQQSSEPVIGADTIGMINISELEQLRGKMTPGEYETAGSAGGYDESDIVSRMPDDDLSEVSCNALRDDAAGLCAEHNAMPALLALARAVVELEQAKREFEAAGAAWSHFVIECIDEGIRAKKDKCLAAYDAARAAVTL